MPPKSPVTKAPSSDIGSGLLANKRILIVDDNKLAADAPALLLRIAGNDDPGTMRLPTIAKADALASSKVSLPFEHLDLHNNWIRFSIAGQARWASISATIAY
jgi:hypothetical protein